MMNSIYSNLLNSAWFILIFHGLCVYSLDYYEDGYLSDLSTDWGMLGDRVHQPKCVTIPKTMSLCRDIGYQEMRLPNLLEHETLAEVVDQARVWVPLLNLHCHPDTKLFLCSLYSPVCLERPIYPCRSLCEGVKRGCEERINNYGFPWPEILRCDKFPEDSDLCIQQVNFETKNVCAACKQPMTWESLLDSYCWANFAARVKISNVIHDNNGDKKLILQSTKFYKKEELTPLDVKQFEPVITNGVTCDCQPITNKKAKLLLMGVKQGSRLVVTYITEWSREPEFKKAVRDIRKKHDCKQQITGIAGMTNENNGGVTNGNPPPSVDGGTDTPETPKRKGSGKRRKGKKKKKNPLDNIAGIGCIPCKQPLVFENLIEKYCSAQFVMKSAVAKLRLDSNGDKRLVLKKKKGKFYKKENLSRRDLRKLQPVISGGANCDCIKANPRKGKIFIMGSKQGARFVLSYLSDWPKDSVFKRFVRAIRKGYDCSEVNTNQA